MAKRPKAGRDQNVCVAQIGAAHGLRGEVRLFSFTQNPEDVRAYGPLVDPDGRPFEIVALRPAGDHFVARFRNIDDRNAAEMLRNIELYVGRDKLPPTDDDDTYYHNDLIGLTATYRDGKKAGEVVAVHNFGAGDLLEIRLEGVGRTALLPFTEQTVPEVKIAAQQIVIDPPEGAFETGPAPKDPASEDSAPKDEG